MGNFCRTVDSAPFDGSTERGPNGRRLCRWCGVEVPKGRRTWCSQECIDQYLIRSDSRFARDQVKARDHGVCAGCGCSLGAVAKAINRYIRRRLPAVAGVAYFVGAGAVFLKKIGVGVNRRSVQQAGGAHHPLCSRKRFLLDKRGRIAADRAEVILPAAYIDALWDMDHIVPVVHGGGGCGLDNLQTLCLWCHRRKTAEQQRL